MLTIHTRQRWRAAPRQGPVIARPASSIRELFVHYPGAHGHIIPADGWTEKREQEIMRELQRQHMKDNGWSDIGYNHVLFPNPNGVPRIYTARGAKYVPAAQLNHNAGTIAIMVYMGTTDTLHVSTQDRLRSYVRWADRYTNRTLRVRGHGDVVQTDCPGAALRGWVRAAKHR